VLDKLIIVVLLALWSVSALHAQCAPLQIDPSKLPNRATSHQPLLPESGYLSDTTYTNEFFGFALDLPIAAQGHLVKLPLMPERQHALLAIAYQNGDRSGSLTIDAIEPREGLEGFSAQQQQRQLSTRAPSAIQTGAQSEPQLQPQVGPQGTVELAPQARLAMPQFQAPADRFHSSVRHSGEKYTALYWTQIKNYEVGVLVATNDKEFLQKSRRALTAALFYCTADDGTLATKDGKLVTPAGERYEGPTVPTWRADAAINAQPGLEIPPEKLAGAYIATQRWACSTRYLRAGTFCLPTTAELRPRTSRGCASSNSCMPARALFCASRRIAPARSPAPATSRRSSCAHSIRLVSPCQLPPR